MERTLSEPLVVENPLGSEPETAENSAPKEDKAKAPKTKRVPKEGGKTKGEPRSKEAGGFLSKYVREQGYRHAEKSAAPQA